jgi:nitroreductase
LCWDVCPFRAWELVEGEEPHLVENHDCFSCYNCMVVCPTDAISIVEPYHVDAGGFYATLPHALEARPPTKPLDADGNADEWTTVEKAILRRRSTRNFKDKPVPEHLVRRVLEAGRFAPSAGNAQPWKFIVITNKALIDEINEGAWAGINFMHTMYMDDELVKQLAAGYEIMPQPALYDPRLVIAGLGSAAKRNGPILLAAPVVVFILEDERGISAGGINIGICGENMALAANSLGLGVCWVGFATIAGLIPPLAEKLGIQPPWKLMAALVMGYPRFKQDGMVPREYRPVTWFREGVDGPVEE